MTRRIILNLATGLLWVLRGKVAQAKMVAPGKKRVEKLQIALAAVDVRLGQGRQREPLALGRKVESQTYQSLRNFARLFTHTGSCG